MSKKYSDLFKDPRWQKLRLQILERDGFACQRCFDEQNTLHVHHRYYEYGNKPWEYDDDMLITLCEECHKHEEDNKKETNLQLINSFRDRFLSDEIVEFSDTISNIDLRHIPEVFMTSLRFFLNHKEKVDEMLEFYFESIKSKDKVKNGK